MLLTQLKSKQKKILDLFILSGKKKYNVKPCEDLSPIGWHILHCTYIETFWIKNYLLEDNTLSDKLKSNFDANTIGLKNRGKNLPKFEEIFNLAKSVFKENRQLLLKTFSKKKVLKKMSLKYLKNFLVNHHAQHIETMYMILNILNLKYNSDFKEYAIEVEPKEFSFSYIHLKKKNYYIGTSSKEFSYDNEKPINKITLNDFSISKNLITVAQWKAFIDAGGYKNKKYWTAKSWVWKENNHVNKPLNWKRNKNKISLSTPNGFVSPHFDYPVTNISKYELEAFANWVSLKLPHEHQLETSSHKLLDNFKAWQWCSNEFYPYSGFQSFPYKEYSLPWFNKNYFTLKGASIYTEKEMLRCSFRNFYKPENRFIFSGGRLASYDSI